MSYEYKTFLNKLSKDLAKYTQEEIESVLAGQAKFGIIDNVIEKIKGEIKKLDQSDLEKVLNGEIKFGIKKTRIAAKKNPDPVDYNQIKEFLRKTESREDAEAFIEKACKNKTILVQLAKYLELEVKSSDKRSELVFKIVNGTVGTRLKSNVFRSDR